jgi:uncharacterized protein YqkB
MSKYHSARVKNAIRLAKDLKEAAARRGSGMRIAYLGDLIKPECLFIDEEKGNVYIKENNCIFIVFENDPTVDEGLELTIPQYTEFFRNTFTLYMPISW